MTSEIGRLFIGLRRIILVTILTEGHSLHPLMDWDVTDGGKMHIARKNHSAKVTPSGNPRLMCRNPGCNLMGYPGVLRPWTTAAFPIAAAGTSWSPSGDDGTVFECPLCHHRWGKSDIKRQWKVCRWCLERGLSPSSPVPPRGRADGTGGLQHAGRGMHAPPRSSP